MFKKLVGDRSFYRRMFAILIPIVVQNGITNFVSLLDNIMVGRVGTLEMSGVSITNQLLFVFNLCIYGAMAGAGIFTAQFCGSGDDTGVRYTFRYKLMEAVLLSVAGGVLFYFFGEPLISLFLTGEGTPADVAATLSFGRSYLGVMLWGLLPFSLSSAYSSTLRENGQAMVPMYAGVGAVSVNLILNYILIFGHFGAPKMGIIGAAVATVISRYVELAIVAVWAHTHSDRHPFIKGAYRSLHIPRKLLVSLFLKGFPLFFNEALWSTGMTVLTQCYSTRGLDVVAALNISSTVTNLTNIVFISMGSTVGIIIGQMLGMGVEEAEVRDTDRKLIAASVVFSLGVGCVLAAISGLFPLLYNTTDQVRDLAARLILVSAVMMPISAYTYGIYFTMRSGGCTGIVFLYDNCFMWMLVVPLAFLVSRLTIMPILPFYALCQSMEILKSGIGTFLLRSKLWVRRLAASAEGEPEGLAHS